MSDQYDSIRSYTDEEVNPYLRSLKNNQELYQAILKLTLNNTTKWLRFIVRLCFPLAWYWRWNTINNSIYSIKALQADVKKLLNHSLSVSCDDFTYIGIEQLDMGTAYLFMSNHRDIAMDPALLNVALDDHQFDTAYIAVGDNLLSKPFAETIMRLNKSFIVRRNVEGKREAFKQLQLLSHYINFLQEEQQANVWIAQREGRAKDGNDLTEEAVVKMLLLHKGKQGELADHIKALNIVPVAVSYEWDPCDIEKATHLILEAERGYYQKTEHEDVETIGKGIVGYKGRIHLAIAPPIDFEVNTVKELIQHIDTRIMQRMHLFPSHYAAAKMLGFRQFPSSWELPTLKEIEHAEQLLKQRLQNVDAKIAQQVIQTYANTLLNKAQHEKMSLTI